MLPALYEDQRAALSRIAAMLIVGAAVVLPMTAQSSSVASASGQQPRIAKAFPSAPGRLTYPEIDLKRDPFRSESFFAEARVSNSGVMQEGQANAIGVVLPPNAGATGAAPVGDPVVRAVVTGAQGRALIDIGGTVTVFTIGDRIGEQRITAIGANGVRLSDGTTLPLAGKE